MMRESGFIDIFFFAAYANSTFDTEITEVMKHCVSSEFREAMTFIINYISTQKSLS
jgi:hypothetical protein